MITTEFKKRVVTEIEHTSSNYPSANKQAKSLSINAAQLSRIRKGELDAVLSDAKWMSIARRLQVSLNPNQKWHPAKTPVLTYIFSQLRHCKENALSGLLCDYSDIGKTYSAKEFARQNPNTVYIDCSQVKSKQRLVRRIAQEFGVDFSGRYADVYEELCYYLNASESPLVILDEAGDLDYNAFLELKAMWNATERACGWYMMGADGLKAKIERHKALKKVGYVELFSRFGNRYQKVSPDGSEDNSEFKLTQVMMIATANGYPSSGVRKLYAETGGSLRRVMIELSK